MGIRRDLRTYRCWSLLPNSFRVACFYVIYGCASLSGYKLYNKVSRSRQEPFCPRMGQFRLVPILKDS